MSSFRHRPTAVWISPPTTTPRQDACRTAIVTGLVSLIGFKPDRTPYVAGSAFIIEAGGAWAIKVSAAYVFIGIRDAQSPRRHVPAAPPEFFGGPVDSRSEEGVQQGKQGQLAASSYNIMNNSQVISGSRRSCRGVCRSPRRIVRGNGLDEAEPVALDMVDHHVLPLAMRGDLNIQASQALDLVRRRRLRGNVRWSGQGP